MAGVWRSKRHEAKKYLEGTVSSFQPFHLGEDAIAGGRTRRTVLSSADATLSSGTPYWPVRSASHPAYPALDQDITCDAVVVGGGISGALIAYRLVWAGVKTVLIDKGRFASGSTSASTALISYEFDLMLSKLMALIGEKSAVRAYELCYQATSRIKELIRELQDPCDYEDKVSIRVTNNEADRETLSHEARLRTGLGMKVELLERDKLLAKYGITAQLGLVSDNAAQIDPYKLAHRLIARATRQGLGAFENTKATTFESVRDGVVLGVASGCRIQARRAIFATGYESEKYLGSTGAKRSTDFCFISEPVKSMGDLSKCHVVENTEDYLYLSTFGNRIMAGLEGKAFYYPGERSALLAKRTREVLERLSVYLPDAKLKVAYHWAATFINSRDSLPCLGSSKEYSGALFALGYGGNGIASSAMLSPIVVDLVLGRKNADAKIFRLDR